MPRIGKTPVGLKRSEHEFNVTIDAACKKLRAAVNLLRTYRNLDVDYITVEAVISRVKARKFKRRKP